MSKFSCLLDVPVFSCLIIPSNYGITLPEGTVCSSWLRLLHGSIAGSAEICIDFISSIFCVFMDISEMINYAVKVLPGNIVVALPNT